VYDILLTSGAMLPERLRAMIPVMIREERLEVVSKPQIASKDKTRVDEKAQHTREYVSISKKLATQYLGVRWGFETTSRFLSGFAGG
jgi:hypothetical protein